MYIPFRAMIERSQMTPYHKKLFSVSEGVATTLAKKNADGLYWRTAHWHFLLVGLTKK